MEFNFSKKLDMFKTGIFALLNDKKEELMKDGKKVYNFSVGTPDFKPQENIINALVEAAKDPVNYKYALTDRTKLLKAVQSFYKKRFDVDLNLDEIMSLYGSQEGMAHIALALCDAEDTILVPNPGYPVFSIGPMLTGCNVATYPLYKKNDFVLDFNDIDEKIAKKARFMIVSYPLNPVCVTAPDSFYEKLIEFANKYNIIILHDNAYSDIVFNGEVGKSFLSYKGAKEVGIEFYSLSKSYNLTGSRISFAIGNKEIIDKFKIIRSQIDYGIFLPIQYAAIEALTGNQDNVKLQCIEYEKRNKALCGGLRSIGWDVEDSKATMFVWAPLPKGYTNSEDFCMELVEKSGVLCVPGSSFGSLGEGFVRFALVHDIDTINEAIDSIKNCGILNK